MKKVKPDINHIRDEQIAREYYAVEDCNGVIRCSCGRELIKMDETTYRCSGGYPIYRFEDDSVIIDKFGNLAFKYKNHDEDGNKKKD